MKSAARREAAGRQMASAVALGMAVAVLTACAPTQTASMRAAAPGLYAEAPTWVTRGCRAYWPSEEEAATVVCGIGTAAASRNPIATRETAVARARAAVARSVEVTIESLVRLEETGSGEGELQSIIHQLTSASLPGAQLESVWRADSGETHALVSLRVSDVQRSVRTTSLLSPRGREDLAQRAADAFARLQSEEAEEAEEAEQANSSE